MEILTKATPQAPKFIIYGQAGSGKTTLASKLKNSLIIDIEGGANFLDVPRTPQVTSLSIFDDYIVELWKAPKREFDYIIIDSVDWLMRLIVEKVAGIDRKNLTETLNKSNGGYGNGKQVLENYVRTKLLPALVALTKRGYGVCLIAHTDKKTMMTANGYDQEQITPKIDAKTLNSFLEWCDGIFYLKKDSAGNRTLLLESDDVAVAKNRLGLTGEIDIANTDINDILKSSTNNKGE